MKNVMGTIGDGTKRFGGGTADLAKRVGGGTADLAKRVGPKRAAIGLAVIGVAVVGSIFVIRYLRARGEEMSEDGAERSMKKQGKKAKNAVEHHVSH